jgi:hypothetical protein
MLPVKYQDCHAINVRTLHGLLCGVPQMVCGPGLQWVLMKYIVPHARSLMCCGDPAPRECACDDPWDVRVASHAHDVRVRFAARSKQGLSKIYFSTKFLYVALCCSWSTCRPQRRNGNRLLTKLAIIGFNLLKKRSRIIEFSEHDKILSRTHKIWRGWN